MVRYKITTPEQVHFHCEIAGLATRAMAWMIDQLLLWAVRIAVIVALGGLGNIGVALAMLGIFVLDFGYYIFFELYWAGQSPGKRMYKIRVMSARGGRLKFPEVFIRNLVRPLDMMLIVPIIGGAVAFFDPIRRRLGDLVAETIVVRDTRIELPNHVARQQGRVNTFETDTAIKNRILTRATRDERDLLLDLMIRRDELDPGVREDIFHQAAEFFRERYNLPEDLEYLSDEQTVLNLALVLLRATFTG